MPTLNWVGKEAVVNHHLQVPFHLLADVPESRSNGRCLFVMPKEATFRSSRRRCAEVESSD